MPPRASRTPVPDPPPAGDAGDDDDPPTRGEVRTMVGDVLDEKLAPILEKLGGKPAAPAAPAEDPDKRYTRQDLEEFAAGKVAEVSAKLDAGDGGGAGSSGGTGGSNPPPPPVEVPPKAAGGWLRRVMWGDAE